jgi:hypothetical protein
MWKVFIMALLSVTMALGSSLEERDRVPETQLKQKMGVVVGTRLEHLHKVMYGNIDGVPMVMKLGQRVRDAVTRADKELTYEDVREVLYGFLENQLKITDVLTFEYQSVLQTTLKYLPLYGLGIRELNVARKIITLLERLESRMNYVLKVNMSKEAVNDVLRLREQTKALEEVYSSVPRFDPSEMNTIRQDRDWILLQMLDQQPWPPLVFGFYTPCTDAILLSECVGGKTVEYRLSWGGNNVPIMMKGIYLDPAVVWNGGRVKQYHYCYGNIAMYEDLKSLIKQVTDDDISKLPEYDRRLLVEFRRCMEADECKENRDKTREMAMIRVEQEIRKFRHSLKIYPGIMFLDCYDESVEDEKRREVHVMLVSWLMDVFKRVFSFDFEPFLHSYWNTTMRETMHGWMRGNKFGPNDILGVEICHTIARNRMSRKWAESDRDWKALIEVTEKVIRGSISADNTEQWPDRLKQRIFFGSDRDLTSENKEKAVKYYIVAKLANMELEHSIRVQKGVNIWEKLRKDEEEWKKDRSRYIKEIEEDETQFLKNYPAMKEMMNLRQQLLISLGNKEVPEED